MNTHAMNSSNGKKHAHSGMLYNRSKIIGIVNTGNLFATINNQSRLVLVNSAILHLDLKDEMAPKQIVVAPLRLGHDLPATALSLSWSTWSSAAIDSFHAATSGDFRAWL